MTLDQRPSRIEIGGQIIEGPAQPELLTLWRLAQAKVEQAQPLTDLDAWNAVVAEYGRLVGKHHGTLGEVVQVIRERCEEAPGGD